MARLAPRSCVRCKALACQCLAVLGMASAALSGPYWLPDAELMVSEFAQIAGYSGSSSSLDAKVDVAGPGVRFLLTLAGSDSGKIGIGDPWPTNATAGFLYDPGEPGGCRPHDTSLYGYDGYSMWVSYVDGPPGSDIDIGLFLNTGLCGPSGYPVSDLTNDTWWGSSWVNVSLGQLAQLELLFFSAEAWGVSDNKVPHTGGGLAWPDGLLYSINDRDRHEISNIGFQIADFDGDALGRRVVVELNAVPEPVSGMLVAGALTMLALYRRRDERKESKGAG